LRYTNKQLFVSLALGLTLLFGIFSTAITSSSSSYVYAQQQQVIIGHFLLKSSVDPLQNENQALITIEYNKIDPKLSDEFEQSVHELGRILRSEGMAYWELFQDPADIGHYIEIRIADHIRHHEYVTKNVQIMEDRIRALIKDCPQPIISHYIGKSPLK
jgi:hypothetical protein